MLAPARARLAALQAVAIQFPLKPTQTLKQVSILFLDIVGFDHNWHNAWTLRPSAP